MMVEPSDSRAQVHYDLGFAYAEMGLDGDAIAELELGLRISPSHRDSLQARVVAARLRGEDSEPSSGGTAH